MTVELPDVENAVPIPGARTCELRYCVTCVIAYFPRPKPVINHSINHIYWAEPKFSQTVVAILLCEWKMLLREKELYISANGCF